MVARRTPRAHFWRGDSAAPGPKSVNPLLALACVSRFCRAGASLATHSLGLKAVDVLGWVSSITLVITLGQQVRKQWVSRDSGGVSLWLFVGQLMASVGFSIYSLLLENWVFLTTNLLLVLNALLGQWVTLRNRRRSDALPGV
jgi:MtN3 and saliva related transmembrane protein